MGFIAAVVNDGAQIVFRDISENSFSHVTLPSRPDAHT